MPGLSLGFQETVHVIPRDLPATASQETPNTFARGFAGVFTYFRAKEPAYAHAYCVEVIYTRYASVKGAREKFCPFFAHILKLSSFRSRS